MFECTVGRSSGYWRHLAASTPGFPTLSRSCFHLPSFSYHYHYHLSLGLSSPISIITHSSIYLVSSLHLLLSPSSIFFPSAPVRTPRPTRTSHTTARRAPTSRPLPRRLAYSRFFFGDGLCRAASTCNQEAISSPIVSFRWTSGSGSWDFVSAPMQTLNHPRSTRV